MNYMSNDALCGKPSVETPPQVIVPEIEAECFVPGENTTPTTPQLVGRPGPRPGRVRDFAGDKDENEEQADERPLIAKIEETRDSQDLFDEAEDEDKSPHELMLIMLPLFATRSWGSRI